MIRQLIYLEPCDWTVIVYYDAGRENADEILQALQRLGCSDSALARAENNLSGSMIDTGLTYTNDGVRSSVVVISEASDSGEFWNTLDHEKGHLAKHIAEALGMECSGEKVQYLSGDIARAMYPVARLFIR